MKAVVFLALCVACVVAEEATEQSEPLSMEPFTQPAQSIPQLVAQEEYQRRLGDLLIGSQQAMYFQQLAFLELRAASGDSPTNAAIDRRSVLATPIDEGVTYPVEPALDDDEDDAKSLEQQSFNHHNLEEELDSDSESFLELKTEAEPFFSPFMMGAGAAHPNGLGYAPFMGMGMGMGMGYGMGAAAGGNDGADSGQLLIQSNNAKIAALKFAHIQIAAAAGDVERSYWMNKLMQTALPPQFLIYKVYKTYLSTIALSLAIQVHDAFTLEAYAEHFNLNHPEGGESALAMEAMAEFQLYSKWHSLAMIRYQLFYMDLYEQYSAMAMTQQPQAPPAASSYLEVEEELKAEPSQFQDPRAALMYTQYLRMYSRYLRFVVLYSEMSMTSLGLMSSAQGVKALMNPESADEKGTEQAVQMAKMLPYSMAQWASALTTKYSIEYYSMMLDLYAPMFAPARDAERASNAMLNTNFVQTEQPVAQ